MTTAPTKKPLPAQGPEPQPMRHMYTGKDRTELVSKLTTRVPYQLRAQMKAITSYPPFGYRTQTQMYTRCMVDFIRDRPWESGWKWRQSSKADAENPLYHLHLEPQALVGQDGTQQEVTGSALKNRVLELAEECDVNQASFTLTFLWWVALERHPIPGLVESLMTVRGAAV
jgi:hypothetical protein